MAIRSKRLKDIQPGNLPEGYHFCRKCVEVKKQTEFYKASNFYIDTAGFFSVCKTCMGTIYTDYLNEFNGSLHMTMLKLCKTFDVLYNEDALNSALKQMETRNVDPTKIFGIYLAKLIIVTKNTLTDTAQTIDLSYKDSPIVNLNEADNVYGQFEIDEDLKMFWGTDDPDQIAFLENEFSEFKQTHKVDTRAEITLLKHICYKQWEIEKNRKSNKPVDADLKQLMELMKNLAISPNMANAAGSGKSADSFGMWIKEIENNSPAEWVKDKSAFKDVDNLEEYTQTYIVSPLRSFVTGNKEFSIEGVEDDDEGDDE